MTLADQRDLTVSAALYEEPPELLRQERGAVFDGVAESFAALFRPDEGGALPLPERLTAAARTAALHDDSDLAGVYQEQAQASGAPEAGGTRLAAELRHVDLLATRPVEARTRDLRALEAAGLSTREIVTLSQVVGFVSFQVRARLTLRALRGASTPDAPGDPLRVATARHRFTQLQLEYEAWLRPLDLAAATVEQRRALPPSREKSPYFRLLAHDAPVLLARTRTDQAIFRSPGGLPFGERELAAAVTSRVNGCVYCASVHSRFAAAFSGRDDAVERLLEQGIEAEQDPRWRALVDAAAALTQTPPRWTAAGLEGLRDQGLDDLQLFDLGFSTAFFAWANRLMLTLGEPVFPAADD